MLNDASVTVEREREREKGTSDKGNEQGKEIFERERELMLV